MLQEPKVNEVWKDNDPRMTGRLLVVESFDDRYVYFRHQRWPLDKTRILRKFLKPDGREYRSGFSRAKQ